MHIDRKYLEIGERVLSVKAVAPEIQIEFRTGWQAKAVDCGLANSRADYSMLSWFKRRRIFGTDSSMSVSSRAT